MGSGARFRTLEISPPTPLSPLTLTRRSLSAVRRALSAVSLPCWSSSALKRASIAWGRKRRGVREAGIAMRHGPRPPRLRPAAGAAAGAPAVRGVESAPPSPHLGGMVGVDSLRLGLWEVRRDVSARATRQAVKAGGGPGAAGRARAPMRSDAARAATAARRPQSGAHHPLQPHLGAQGSQLRLELHDAAGHRGVRGGGRRREGAGGVRARVAERTRWRGRGRWRVPRPG